MQTILGWRPIKRQIIYGVLTLVVVLAVFLLTRTNYGCDWTGFGQCSIPVPTGQEVRREKTLWDFLELIIVPLALVGAGVWLNRQEKERDLQRARSDKETADAAKLRDEERAKLERQRDRNIEQNMRENDQRLTERIARAEQTRIRDTQQESALQAYVDRMCELLTDQELKTTTQDIILQVARSRTLMTLSRLDAERKGSILRFLWESELLRRENPRVRLFDADLTGAEVVGANLSGSDLRGANLNGSYLFQANLSDSDLRGANLKGSDLHDANLNCSDLRGASLNGSDLRGASLNGSDLRGATYNTKTQWTENLSNPQALGIILVDE